MQDAYHSLIKDAIVFLKEQKKRSLFAKKEDLPYLKTTPAKKEEKATIRPSQKTQPTAPFVPRAQQENRQSPPLSEKKEKPILEKPIASLLPKTPPLHQKAPASSHSFEEMKRLLQTASPHFALHEEIPSDETAKQHAMEWVYKKQGATITLLCGKEDPAKITLLKNLTKALHVRYASAQMVFALDIEKENGWELFLSNPEIKLILAIEHSIASFPHLMSCYREIPARKEHFLNNAPLFLLPDLGLYLKKSSLKPVLWKTITQKIAELFAKNE
jgi:hypothetical protein